MPFLWHTLVDLLKYISRIYCHCSECIQLILNLFFFFFLVRILNLINIAHFAFILYQILNQWWVLFYCNGDDGGNPLGRKRKLLLIIAAIVIVGVSLLGTIMYCLWRKINKKGTSNKDLCATFSGQYIIHALFECGNKTISAKFFILRWYKDA